MAAAEKEKKKIAAAEEGKEKVQERENKVVFSRIAEKKDDLRNLMAAREHSLEDGEVENYSWITEDDSENESVEGELVPASARAEDDSENKSGAEDVLGNESVGGEVVSASAGADTETNSVGEDIMSQKISPSRASTEA